MATIQDAINIARPILNDTDASSYRWSDVDLLKYGNNALDAICSVMPHLFYTVAQLTCIAGTVNQAFSPDDSVKFISVEGINGGGAVQETTVDILNRMVPSWRSDAAGVATDWAPHDGSDPNRFYIYPPSPVGQILIGKYVKVPGEWTADQTHELANLYTPAIAQYIVAMALGRKNDVGDNSSSAVNLNAFYTALGIEKDSITNPTQ